MLRVVFVLLLSTVALAQETQSGELLPVSTFAETGLQPPDFALNGLVTTYVADTGVAETSLSSLATAPLSSGKPVVLQASNALPPEPLLVSTATKPTHTPSVQQKRVWWMLTAAQHSAATFDAWSTRSSIESGNGYERNPLLKPFAGSSAIYPVIQVLPLGLDYVSKRMMRSRHGFFRKAWWVPQALATAGFVWSGAQNIRVANLK